ncbi:MAG: hypothetical protein IT452_11500 [Planctomycetia bacterium]|nr:hypothetical protein [Planctomycetia bacterium]
MIPAAVADPRPHLASPRPESSAAAPSIRPPAITANGITALASLGHLFLGGVALAVSPSIGREEWGWLAPFCLLSIALIAAMLVAMWKSCGTAIVQETAAFLALSTGVYFSFGPLLHVFGPADAIAYSRSWFPIGAEDAVRITGINFVGFAISGLTCASIRLGIISHIAERTARSWARVPPATVFLLFALVGVVTQFLFVLPYDLRLSQAAPSGLLRQAENLGVIAIMVGWASRRNGPRWVDPCAKALLVLEICIGLLQFNKNASLLPVLAAGIGEYLGTRNTRNVLISATLAILLYWFLVPIVTYGRQELSPRSGGEPAPADLMERKDIVMRYFTTRQFRDPADEIPSGWWVRLNYLSPQQAGLEMYERGYGGDDFGRVAWIVVPRFINPDKPEMTVAGVDFNQKVVGFRTTSTGTGVFVDGYYNLGWLGVLITSLTYGLALRVYANIARPVLQAGAFIMYPLVFKGVHVALRADGWWLADVAGPVVFVVVAMIGLGVVSRR